MSDAVRLLMRAALEVGYVLVFGAVVLGIFLMLWQGHEGRRILLLGLLGAIVAARIVAALANLLLAPSRPEARLLPLDDAAAGTLSGAVTIVAALFGGLHPLGTIPASIIFGALLVGGDKMQRAVQVPNSLIDAILGLVVLFVVGSALWSRRWAARRQMEAAKNQEEQA